MPFDGSGNFNRVMNWVSDAAASIKIRADRHDQEDDNFASGLSNVITKDGQTQPTANIPMNGKRIINLAAPVNPTDAATKAYAESIRNFNTPIVLSGSGLQSRIEFPVPNLSFGGVGSADPRFIWNDKADMSGNDLMALRPGKLTMAGSFECGGTSSIIGPAAAGNIILRPNGVTSSTGQMVVGSTGNITVVGNISNGGTISGGSTIQAAAGFLGNAANAILAVDGSGGNVWLRPNGVGSTVGQMRVDSAGSVLTSGDIIATGSIRADGQLISQAVGGTNPTLTFRNNAAAVVSTMSLAISSGVLVIDNRFAGTGQQLQLGSTGNLNLIGSSANITIAGSVATKAVAGQWTAPSDIRLKDVHGDYLHGLAELKQVQPVIFSYKADPNAHQYPGMIAQDIETVFPEMITLTEGEVDGNWVNDLRQFDPTAIQYALINAVKELATRVEALEAA